MAQQKEFLRLAALLKGIKVELAGQIKSARRQKIKMGLVGRMHACGISRGTHGAVPECSEEL
jgi:hypothetical protein